MDEKAKVRKRISYHVFADPKIEDYKAFNLKNNLDEFVNLK